METCRDFLDMLKNFWKKIFRLLSKLPIVGHLFSCKRPDYWAAFVEYFNAFLWSTMPFWLGAFLIFAQTSNGDTSFLNTLIGTFKNGELLVYTIGTLTPITFMTLFEHHNQRFPHRLGLGTIAIVMIIGCASLFALQKAHVPTKNEYIYFSSLALAIAAVAFRYIAMVYNRVKLPTVNEKQLTQTTSTLEEELNAALLQGRDLIAQAGAIDLNPGNQT